jgi:hypothetical protein
LTSEEKVLAAIAALATKIDYVDANVEATRHEVANLALASVRQSNDLAELKGRVSNLETVGPRPPMSTLGEIARESVTQGAGSRRATTVASRTFTRMSGWMHRPSPAL